MSLKLAGTTSWLGILLGYCPIAGIARAIGGGMQRPVLVGALTIAFVVVNLVGLVLAVRRNAGADPRFGYGLMVGAVVATVVWFFAP